MPAETFDHPKDQGPEVVDAETTVERRFATGDHCRLVIENPRGRIRVSGCDRPEVTLRVTKLRDGSTAARFDATRVEIRHEGGTISARTIVDGGLSFRDDAAWGELLASAVRFLGEAIRSALMPVEVDYEVQVPRHADLDLKVVTSRVAVENVRGAVHVASVSGAQDLARVKGDISLSTVSGEIGARELAGSLDVNSVSGGVSLAGSLDALRANVVSGSIELAGPLATTGSYDFHTVSGSVTLRLPPETAATIDARGVSMAVSSDLPCRVTRDRRGPGSHYWQGQINGGDAAVRLNTVSGHLYLAELPEIARASAGQAPEPSEPGGTPTDTTERPAAEQPGAPAPEASADEQPAPPTGEDPAAGSAQLRVLRALERGELTVDEALEQIETLRRHAQ